MTSVGCVVLSQGNRPAELRRALDSVLGQLGVELDCVVVGNGWAPVDLPDHARGVALAENVGVPEGRNIGAGAVAGDVLLFLDDDAELVGDGMLAVVTERFDADPMLSVLQPRAVDPDGAPTSRRHVPRLRASDPDRSGDVAWFWEGCSFIRRSALQRAGGWPGDFFYGHEGIELAWRVIDAAAGSLTPRTCRCATRRCRRSAATGTATSTRGTGSGWRAATCPSRWPRPTSRCGQARRSPERARPRR